jgi:hypothetical protein
MGHWVARENPPPDLVFAVKRWLVNRTYDPFDGLRREDLDTWRGRVPGTALAGTCRVDPEQRSILIDAIVTDAN